MYQKIKGFNNMRQADFSNIDHFRKRLIFRSGHRGTKEMDLILGGFAARYVPQFSVEQLRVYEALLEESDPDLYNWITGQDTPPESVKSGVLDMVLAYRHET